MDKVMKHIVDSLRTEWTTPDDAGMMYITREGGYQGKTYDIDDLFWHIGFPTSRIDLQVDIKELIGVDYLWCKLYYFTGNRNDALIHSWDHLVSIIKHEKRYLFLKMRQPENSSGGYNIDPADLLDEIMHELRILKLERVLKQGMNVYRCRIHKKTENFSTSEQLGPPKPEKARSSRMNPAGISLMYAASNKDTAFAETANPTKENVGKIATIADFELLRDIRILDLTELPDIPSLYDDANRHKRDGITFLHSFMMDITKPVTKDGSEHLDYFPPQVVSEYIRHVYKDGNGNGVEGIAYTSAVDQAGKNDALFNQPGKNYALFLKQDDCCDDRSQAKGKAVLLRKDLLKRQALPTG